MISELKSDEAIGWFTCSDWENGKEVAKNNFEPLMNMFLNITFTIDVKCMSTKNSSNITGVEKSISEILIDILHHFYMD